MQQALQPLLAAEKLARRLRTSVGGKNSTEGIRCYDVEILEKKRAKQKNNQKEKARNLKRETAATLTPFWFPHLLSFCSSLLYNIRISTLLLVRPVLL